MLTKNSFKKKLILIFLSKEKYILLLNYVKKNIFTKQSKASGNRFKKSSLKLIKDKTM